MMTPENLIEPQHRPGSVGFINHAVDNAEYVSENRDSFTNDLCELS